MQKLLAFHSDEKIKEKYLKRVEAHRLADEIKKGFYWENGKGCAVGCTVEVGMDAHAAMEKELGIPVELAYLEDVIFEELPNDLAKEWPGKFLSAITPGADLSLIVAKFTVWQFEDSKVGLSTIKEVMDNEEVAGFCKEVVALYQREIRGDKVSEDEFFQLYLKIDRSDARTWATAWATARAGARAGAWATARAGAGVEYEKNIVVLSERLIELLLEATLYGAKGVL